MNRKLAALVALARTRYGVDPQRHVNWTSIDQSLFARIEEDRTAERSRLAEPRDRRWAYFASTAMAATAVLGIFLGKQREPSPAPPALAAVDPLAGKISGVRGDGAVLLNGIAVGPGASVRLGDRIETRGAEATLVREGKLVVEIEPSSRLSVRQVREPLVLALDRGAVEARVTPVAAGEAFAVDVAGTRIAVHGTVLRVAKRGDRAAIDLTQGAVSIGVAPRVGPVLGSLVTAPAHVEFSVTDAAATMTVTHDPSSVRPVPMTAQPEPAVEPRFAEPQRGLRDKAAPSAPSLVHSPTAAAVHLDGRGAGSVPGSQAAMTADAGASDSVEAAVLACMAERPRAENVTVLVRTTLYLDVGDDGAVRSARFDPPVLPDVNGCAAAAIYKTRFPHPGAVALPIRFEN